MIQSTNRYRKEVVVDHATISIRIKNENIKALDLATMEAYNPSLQGFLSDLCNKWLEDWKLNHENSS